MQSLFKNSFRTGQSPHMLACLRQSIFGSLAVKQYNIAISMQMSNILFLLCNAIVNTYYRNKYLGRALPNVRQALPAATNGLDRFILATAVQIRQSHATTQTPPLKFSPLHAFDSTPSSTYYGASTQPDTDYGSKVAGCFSLVRFPLVDFVFI